MLSYYSEQFFTNGDFNACFLEYFSIYFYTVKSWIFYITWLWLQKGHPMLVKTYPKKCCCQNLVDFSLKKPKLQWFTLNQRDQNILICTICIHTLHIKIFWYVLYAYIQHIPKYFYSVHCILLVYWLIGVPACQEYSPYSQQKPTRSWYTRTPCSSKRVHLEV